MRIAQIAPLAESVPPALYGGTERVVSTLTEELVRRGHEVTLFASGDSRTDARLIPCAPRSLRLDPDLTDALRPTLTQLNEVYCRGDEFDVIHNHIDYLAFPYARRCPTPTVTTLHGRLDLPDIQRTHSKFRDQLLVSISRDQASHMPDARWVATVPHGIDVTNLRFRESPGEYLVFLGRMSPEKRPDRAIAVAEATGMKLVMAAKVDHVDADYFETVVKPLIDSSPLVDFIGEVNDEAKDELLGGAYASIFPIDWPEPFGLTMVEAMATGTPVIASRRGSVPEVLVNGVTGFICDSIEEMVEAVEKAGHIDRAACRRHVERNFVPEVMAAHYEVVYRSVSETQVRQTIDSQLFVIPATRADLALQVN